jgi:hypothetical protein
MSEDPKYVYTITTDKPFKPDVIHILQDTDGFEYVTAWRYVNPITLVLESTFNAERFIVDILQRQFVSVLWKLDVEIFDIYESEEYQYTGRNILETYITPIPQIITEWGILDIRDRSKDIEEEERLMNMPDEDDNPVISINPFPNSEEVAEEVE